MKKFLKWAGIAFIGFIVIGILASALGGNKTVTTSAPPSQSKPKFVIKITGTPGIEFSGSYMVVTADGKSVSKSVDGKVPAEYPVDGSMVSTSFQKKGENGKLKVEIFKGDKVAAESETEAAYGVVSAATQ